jgi:hypothetical protein
MLFKPKKAPQGQNRPKTAENRQNMQVNEESENLTPAFIHSINFEENNLQQE